MKNFTRRFVNWSNMKPNSKHKGSAHQFYRKNSIRHTKNYHKAVKVR